MATATAEPEVKAYVMPAVHIGMPVHFYVDADPKMQPQLGIVVEFGPRNLSCRLQLRTDNAPVKYDVRHVTDPILQTNREVRRNGSWCYTPETLLLKDLAARVATLEEIYVK